MISAPFSAPLASGASRTVIVSPESTYACCSLLTVRPVTITFHFDRSSWGAEKSSKKSSSGFGVGVWDGGAAAVINETVIRTGSRSGRIRAYIRPHNISELQGVLI